MDLVNVTDDYTVSVTLVTNVSYWPEWEEAEATSHNIKVFAVIVGLLCVLLFSIGVRTVITVIRKQRNKPKREQSQSTSQQRTTTSEQNRQDTDILTEQETGDSISLYVNIPTPRPSRAENIVKPSLAKEQSHTYDNVPTDVNELSENKSSKRPKAQGLANLGSDRNAVATVVQSHHQTNPIFSRVKEVSNSKNESLLNADDQVHYLSLCESSRSDNEDQLYESYTPEMTLYENV